VGVDNPAWDYRPVSLAQIMRFLETQTARVPVDHHVTEL
jgi:hypothetical protein